jgi:hypothetical protein
MHGGTRRHEKPFSAVQGRCDVAHFGEFWGHTASRRAEGLPMLARTGVMRESPNPQQLSVCAGQQRFKRKTRRPRAAGAIRPASASAFPKPATGALLGFPVCSD